MSKTVCTLLGAGLCGMSMQALADTVPLALRTPFPTPQMTMPQLPDGDVSLSPMPIQRAVQQSSASQLGAHAAAQANVSAFGLPCEAALRVEPTSGAVFELTVSAPCNPYEEVALSYAGLSFDIHIPATGEVSFSMPALAQSALLEAVFEDGVTLSSPLHAPELVDFARIALAWDAALDMQLVAKGPGHVPLSFYTLGDGSRRTVEILSHHQSPESRRAVIRLGMTAPITAQNCGHERRATVRQVQPDLPPVSYELVLAPASCDEIGGNLELKNILQDMTLAAN